MLKKELVLQYSKCLGVLLGNLKTTVMKATIFTFLFISIGLFSCKKKNVDQFISNWVRTNQLKDETSLLLSVPAGNYLTLSFLSTIHKLDGTPMDDCGNMVYVQNNNYAKNVGLVFMNYAYYSKIQSCTNQEKRLINFYIAP